MKRERPLPAEIGRYRIARLHRQGAMGRVLLARDTVLDRDVALKLLRDDLGLAEEHVAALVDRMRQEARAAARVEHPNIVSLHDMGEDPDHGLYLVFEYVEGPTLKERIERGPLGAIAAAKLAVELGDALTTAHEAAVLHRDVKPENVLLARTGAKIADFGIARMPDSTLTMGGTLLGTPAYSAPEAISAGRFSPKSDQFSMACTLYEAISGRRAFPGDDAVTVAGRIGTEEPAAIAQSAGVDAHVDIVLARAFRKDPRERFDSCADFGAALSEALRMAPRSAMPTLPDHRRREHTEDPASARVARAATGGFAVGAMLAIAAFQLTAHLRSAPTAPPAPSAAQSHAPRARPAADAPAVAWLDERPKVMRPAPARTAGRGAESPRPRVADAGAASRDAGAEQRRTEAGAPGRDGGS